jgi:hypothetical protein
MKKKILFLVILLLIFAGVIAGRYMILDRQNASGRVKIVSSPSAGVFIDNVAVGKTPYEDKLEEGEYMVKLIPEGVATETASWQGKISVNKNALTFVNRELGSTDLSSAGEVLGVSDAENHAKTGSHGEVYVETEPSGAIVYFDSDEKGVTPLLLSDVVGGDHEVSVYMPGFFRRTQKINVDPGYRVYAQFKLAADQTQKKLEDIEEEIAEASPSAEEELVEELDENTPTEEASEQSTNVVEIASTPTGWLRVRSLPNLNGSEVGRVTPGDTYEILGEENGWIKIIMDGTEGWISGDYAIRLEEQTIETDNTQNTPEEETQEE